MEFNRFIFKQKIMTIKILPLFLLLLMGCKKDTTPETDNHGTSGEPKLEINHPKIAPVQHATFVMTWGNQVFYVDPTGGKEAFAAQPEPDLILVTDIHGDHFNVETLQQISDNAQIIAPKAVFDKMPVELQVKTKMLSNSEGLSFNGFDISAVPMYNITEERKNFHEKGRGNGYVVSNDGYRVYISGDTEDIPEMRNLENIDLAFLCMNLPYTMAPEAAADAVLDFEPDKVIPYHYRGRKDGEPFYHDVEKFKSIVNSGNANIQVELMDWYPKG